MCIEVIKNSIIRVDDQAKKIKVSARKNQSEEI